MRRSILTFLLTTVAALLLPASATAVTITPPPLPAEPPPVIISAYGGQSMPEFIELYNRSNAAVNMVGWRITATIAAQNGDEMVTISIPTGWLPPGRYVSFQHEVKSDYGVTFTLPKQFPVEARVKRIGIETQEGHLLHDVTIAPADLSNGKWARHKVTPATIKPSNELAKDFTLTAVAPQIFSEPLYQPPETTGLRIIEVLANARDCPPQAMQPDCNDYIKIKNTTQSNVNLADYRLRVGVKGQSVSVTSMFTWGQELTPGNDELLLSPGDFVLLQFRNDGQWLSLSNTGNYIWLEDGYGVKAYEPVIQYPSVPTARKGQSWALDETDATWKWATPAPEAGTNAPLPPSAQGGKGGADTAIKPCRPDQFRNPLTNRCKRKALTTSSLVPCKVGQTRNPATNRCRSTLTVGTSVTPCKPGQTRNPATNRCRSGANSTHALKPCQPGQERNPETNRCRKTTGSGSDAKFGIEKITAPAGFPVGWLAAGVAGIGAAGYGAYEWRREIASGFGRLREKLTGGSK